MGYNKWHKSNVIIKPVVGKGLPENVASNSFIQSTDGVSSSHINM